MTPPSPARSRFAILSRHLAALVLFALIPGGSAWAEPMFKLDVDVMESDLWPPTEEGMGSVGVNVWLDLSDSWCLDDIWIQMPSNARGESYLFDLRYVGPDYGFEDFRDVAGKSGSSWLGFMFQFGDPTGRFIGGLITVRAVRFENGEPWSFDATPIYKTLSVGFSYEILGLATVPEPTAATSAAIAAAGGVAFAAARRRRRAG